MGMICSLFWVKSNLEELLVGIKPRMSGSTAHPKPPTTRLHLDKWHSTL